jgi:hypothetical protein
LFTELKKPRSTAYLTSLDVTTRSTGGENFTPSLIFTVTTLPSSEICGSPSARSGSALTGVVGLVPVERLLRGARDLEAHLVVGPARVDEVDVVRPEIGDLAALLGFAAGGRLGALGAAAALVVVAAAATGDAEREDEEAPSRMVHMDLRIRVLSCRADELKSGRVIGCASPWD